MGIVLVYVLETRVLLSNLASELQGEALLIAQMAGTQESIWGNSVQAQSFLDGLDPRLDPRVMLMDEAGIVLASSDPRDAGLLGQSLTYLDLNRVLTGKVDEGTKYSREMQREIVDVMVPVLDSQSNVVGIVRLSHQYSTVYDDFLKVRYVVGGVLVGGGLLGAAVGLGLALNLERPLQRVTRAVSRLAHGEQLPPLPESGPQEIRSLSSAVNMLVQRLQTLEQSRRQLLANLVHELGRPLGSLRSAIDALEEGADEDAELRHDLLEGMGREVDRLGHLVEDLAGLHDQVLGTLELDLRPTLLRDWIFQTVSPWREAAQAKGLQWRTDISVDLPEIQIDVDRMGQVLGNLLSNAIKYTPVGGTVTVSAGATDREVWIAVSDTGPGISPAERENIFKPFYRSQAGRRFPQGMGLGLSIAHTLALAHGGRLEVDSPPNTGSRFTVWLPL
jgi:signal transduction histidine kinase